MKKKRTTRTAEVTIETEEITVFNANLARLQSGSSAVLWCPDCRRKVEMVSPDRAARIAGVTPREVYRWVEGSLVHFVEGEGHVRICSLSFSGELRTGGRKT